MTPRFLTASIVIVASLGSAASHAAAPVIAGCKIFPDNNYWNVRVDTLPVHADSTTWVNTIGATSGLHPDFGSFYLGDPIGIPFVTVPGSQPPVPVAFDVPDESDAGPYPIPPDAPIEGGPASDGDRHVIVLDRDRCILYETDYAFPVSGGASWTAFSGAKFDLASQALRPDTWTSADAAGLPILPGLVRYDETMAGEISHALRFTAPQTRKAHIWPARHDASSLTGAQYPPMGARFRLKASYVISPAFSVQAQRILRALKKYGMILADNGSRWYVSGEHHPSWDDDALGDLKGLKGSDFEAVDTARMMLQPNSGQALLPTGAATTRDHNGDGKADIRIRNASDGTVYGWLMNGLAISSGGYLLTGGSGWSVANVADFDGDGKADILLKHTDGKADVLLKHTDGSIYVWLMDGATIIGGTYLQGAGTGWTATHVADFNGDGKSDVLLKHTDGSIYVWQMNGIAIAAGTYLLSPGSGWSIARTADLDGDGKSDIIIAHTDGSHYAWIMNGLTIGGGGYLLGAGSGWSVSHTLDLDGDGKQDILLKNTDGSIYAWLMNGAAITGGGYLMGAGTWSVTP